MDWSSIINNINKYDSFVITSHVNLDGDAVGSETALCEFLIKLGKKPCIINNDKIPPSLSFLVQNHIIIDSGSEQARQKIESCDAVFVIDVSNWHHIGIPGKLIQDSGKPVLCIDHHKNDTPIGDTSVINTSAAASGIMIFDLIKTYSEKMFNPAICNSLYTAIITDSGSFRYANTNQQVHDITAQLLEKGTDHSQVCSNIFENNSWSRFRLLHQTLGTLHKESNGKIAWMKITNAMLEDTESSDHDAAGFVDMIKTIQGVEITMVFKEIDQNTTKATFRSKNMVDVQKLAALFNGGGHMRASGATLPYPIDTAIEKVIQQAKKMLKTPKIETLDHTADYMVKIHGSSITDLFEGGLKAITAYCSEKEVLLSQNNSVSAKIDIHRDNLDDLFVSYLNEILYLMEEKKAVFHQIEINKLDELCLSATLHGTLDNDRHKEIKAATYHNFDISFKNQNIVATVVFDV